MGEDRERREAFSAIQMMKPTLRLPAFAGMPPEGLLKNSPNLG
jgi:hypothetical protein